MPRSILIGGATLQRLLGDSFVNRNTPPRCANLSRENGMHQHPNKILDCIKLPIDISTEILSGTVDIKDIERATSKIDDPSRHS